MTWVLEFTFGFASVFFLENLGVLSTKQDEHNFHISKIWQEYTKDVGITGWFIRISKKSHPTTGYQTVEDVCKNPPKKRKIRKTSSCIKVIECIELFTSAFF